MVGARGNEVVLLDACCLMNLYATRFLEQILESLPMEFAIAERVQAEAIYVRRGGTGEDAEERDFIDLSHALGAGLLRVVSPESEPEEEAYVSFATELDDGEAMTCGIAVVRGWSIATDDRKTLRVFGSHSSGLPVHTTAALIKRWVESVNMPTEVLRQVLLDVSERARFIPRNVDPLSGWWKSTTESRGEDE